MARVGINVQMMVNEHKDGMNSLLLSVEDPDVTGSFIGK